MTHVSMFGASRNASSGKLPHKGSLLGSVLLTGFVMFLCALVIIGLAVAIAAHKGLI